MKIQKNLEELEGELTVKNFNAGAILLNEDSYIRNIPIVKSGLLKVVRSDDQGREILLYYIHPGESCIMSFLGAACNNTSKVKAIVEEKAEVIILPIEKAIQWVKTEPAWLEFVFELYNKRFEELLNYIEEVTFKRLDDRIMELLKMKAEATHSNQISITHQKLAEELGSAREVVSRLLKQMENKKLIKLARGKISLYPSL